MSSIMGIIAKSVFPGAIVKQSCPVHLSGKIVVEVKYKIVFYGCQCYSSGYSNSEVGGAIEA
jgi:hypothetical protein